MTNTYLAAPSISGVSVVQTVYNLLGAGTTARIFLLGHADGLTINDPYQVTDINAAVAALQYDSNSPLLRALLECYYGGAKDIFLVAVAPMSGYIADPTQRTDSWYQAYASQLQAAYNVLVNWDVVQYIVPLEAPFNVEVDFLTPLALHCSASLVATGAARIGLLGTRKGSPLTSNDILAMANDPRIVVGGSMYKYGAFAYGSFNYGTMPSSTNLYINHLSDIGQFVALFAGEVIVNLQEMPTTYMTSVVASIAGQLAQLPINQSIINKKLPNVIDLVSLPLSTDVQVAANAGINLITKTTMGKRGRPFQVISLTDNTLALPNSDFWSINSIRAVSTVVDYIEAFARRNLGGTGLGQFQTVVNNYLKALVTTNQIRDFTASVRKDPARLYNVLADISIKPYFGIRTINFTVNVGPGTQ